MAAPTTHPALPAVPMLDLERQYAPIRDEIIAALAEVVDSRQFILGDFVSRFEQEACQHLGIRHAVGCASGTDALWLALAAVRIQDQAVITTPFSFFASVSSILRAGGKPMLCDIDPVSFNLDATQVKKVLGNAPEHSVAAILPVHLYGQCVAWENFTQLAKEFGLALVEDAAQAWGASRGDIKAGGLGDIAAFSFYPTKNLNAAGDAGTVTTNNPELAERTRMLRQHGMRERYHHDELGWNARMDGFQGAVLSVHLRYIEQRNALRREAAQRYHKLFANAGLAENRVYPEQGVVLPQEIGGGRHIWHQYVIRTARRDALRDFLTAQRVGSEIYYPVPLHRQKALEFLGYEDGAFPEAERAAREVLALPIFPEIRADEQERVVRAVAEFLS